MSDQDSVSLGEHGPCRPLAPEDRPETRDAATEPDQGPSTGRMLLIVGLFAAVIYLPFLGSSRTLTRHEVDIAQPAMQFLVDGDWLIPKYEGRPWIHKGVLVNWLVAPLFAVSGGFSEYATRIPAALSAIGLCLLTAGLAARVYNRTAGLLAGLVQATCVWAFTQGRLGECDMTFVFLVAAAHAVLLWQWSRGRFDLPLGSAAMFHTLLGLTMLAKGPHGVIFAGLTVVCLCGAQWTLRPVRAVLLTPAVLCFVVVGLGWYGAVAWQLQETAFSEWHYRYFGRFSGGYHMGRKPLWYYLYTIPWLTLPWSIALVLGARRLVSDVSRPNGLVERFLWCWFFGGLAFLTMSAFKHTHYSFPILPPLSIFCGYLLAEHLFKKGRPARDFYIGAFAVAALAYVIIGGVVMPWRDHRRPTVTFVREFIPQVPQEAPVYMVGFVQEAFYPYVEELRSTVYLQSAEEAAAVLEILAPDEEIWVLTYRRHLDEIDKAGGSFEEIGGEPSRDRYPPDKTLVLGCVRHAPKAVATKPPG